MRSKYKQAIKERLEKGPITFSLMFSYYDELFYLAKEKDMVRVETELMYSDTYEDGTTKFVDVVTYEELMNFLDNRLSEQDSYHLKYENNKEFKTNMEYLLEEVVCEIRKDIAEKKDAEYRKAFLEAFNYIYDIEVSPDKKYLIDVITDEPLRFTEFTFDNKDLSNRDFVEKELNLWIEDRIRMNLFGADEINIHNKAKKRLKDWLKTV